MRSIAPFVCAVLPASLDMLMYRIAPHSTIEPRNGPRTVLVVEDDLDVRAAMADLLRAAGHLVHCAGRGDEARALLLNANPAPDIVFLDLGLPDVSGLEWLREKALLPRGADVPTCLVTGDEVRLEELPDGACVVGCLAKPFEVESLLDAVHLRPLATVTEGSGVRATPSAAPAGPGSRRLSHMLAQASEVLAESLDVERPVCEALGLIVPTLADWCVLDCPGHDGTSRHRPMHFAVHVDSSLSQVLQAAAERAPGPGIVRLVADVLADGKPRVVRDLPPWRDTRMVEPGPHAELLCEVRTSSLLVAPLASRGRVFGTLTLGLSEPGMAFGVDQLDTAVELAHRIALTVDNGRLQHAVHAREQLLAIVSHDLRTPLSAIVICAATLQRSLHQDERSRAAARTVLRNARRMERMIRDLLDFSQLESGRLRVERKREPLLELVRAAVESARPLAHAHDLKLVVDREARSLFASCDRERVSQVLANLLTNAIKYTPVRGRITVRIARAGEECVISVRDTGPGIAADEMPHLFDAYRQGAGCRSGRGRRSMGLGLYIARGLAEAHGGRLWGESVPSEGSAFYLSLPLVS